MRALMPGGAARPARTGSTLKYELIHGDDFGAQGVRQNEEAPTEIPSGTQVSPKNGDQ